MEEEPEPTGFAVLDFGRLECSGKRFRVYGTHVEEFTMDEHGWPHINGERVPDHIVERGWVRV